jgi:hypothetical protein
MELLGEFCKKDQLLLHFKSLYLLNHGWVFLAVVGAGRGLKLSWELHILHFIPSVKRKHYSPGKARGGKNAK